MPTVLLGNTAPIETPEGTSVIVNDERGELPVSLGGRTQVLIVTPDESFGQPVPLDKQLLEVRNAFRIHSAENAAWVEGGDEFFAKAVAQVFDCPVGRPSDWDAPEEPQEAVSAPAEVPTAEVVESVEVKPEEAS